MLEGKRVVITRPEHQAGDLAEIVERMGGRPRIVPTVEIVPVSNLEEVEAPFRLIASGGADVIVFMSQNGVSCFVALAEKLKMKKSVLEALSRMRVVAIGSRTKARLEEQGIWVDIIPEDYSSNGLADTLAKLDLGGKVVALPRTDRPTDYLNQRLAETSAEIVQFPVYETRIPWDVRGVLGLIEDILNSKVDVITFTSSATARNLFHIAEVYRAADRLREALNEKMVVASIGPVTEKTLKSLGVDVHVTPEEYTIDAMMKAVETYLEGEAEGDPDPIDLRILDAIQKTIPLTKRPWVEMGKALGLSGEEVLTRLKKLSRKGVIRKVGPIIDARKVGLKASTLVGMRVSHERIKKISTIINRYDEVSHNYERDHEYNLWFTLTAPNQEELDRLLQKIRGETGVPEKDVLNLQTERLFKIRVNFNLEENR